MFVRRALTLPPSGRNLHVVQVSGAEIPAFLLNLFPARSPVWGSWRLIRSPREPRDFRRGSRAGRAYPPSVSCSLLRSTDRSTCAAWYNGERNGQNPRRQRAQRRLVEGRFGDPSHSRSWTAAARRHSDFVSFAIRSIPLDARCSTRPPSASRIVGADVASLYLLEGDGDELVMRGNVGFPRARAGAGAPLGGRRDHRHGHRVHASHLGRGRAAAPRVPAFPRARRRAIPGLCGGSGAGQGRAPSACSPCSAGAIRPWSDNDIELLGGALGLHRRGGSARRSPRQHARAQRRAAPGAARAR